MPSFAEPLTRLMDALKSLPGIGAKSAQRLAFHVLKAPRKEVEDLAAALLEVKNKLQLCKDCFNIADHDQCPVCADPSRDRTQICVVEEPGNVAVIERAGGYGGLYHVLHGAISPIHGIGPGEIRIAELMTRVKAGGVTEVILATNPTADGETTATHLSSLLKPLQVNVSRIGMGLPVGADIEYVDEVTLSKALAGRRPVT
jgi:recombination protein RecR